MVAGPNGSGKTTLTRALVERGIDLGEYINPDDIARELVGSDFERAVQAQTIADERRAACIADRRSFSFETVMSHPSKVEILHQARDAGFLITLFFVGIDDPRTNIERVALRASRRADMTSGQIELFLGGVAPWRSFMTRSSRPMMPTSSTIVLPACSRPGRGWSSFGGTWKNYRWLLIRSFLRSLPG